MAPDAAAAAGEPSSGDTPRYAIGYALAPKKQQSFIQPSLVARAAARGMDLVPVDAARPLAEQGPFHLLIHKLCGGDWRAQLEAFAARHPAVPVVDPPHAIDRLHNRISMLQVVSELDHAADKDRTFGILGQVVVYDAAALTDSGLLDALRFSLIAKPLIANGTAKSHKMSLVYHCEGLAKLRLPLVLQEFVNHGGVLFKVYVVGDHATCVMRSSLPDVPDARLHDLAADAAAPFANISLLPPPAAGDVEMPPQDFVDRVASELRRALGLHLINFDLIRASDPDGDAIAKYLILDINYCQGYSKMPSFEPVLLDFFLEMLRNRPGHEQPCPGAGSGSGLGAKALKAEVEPIFTPSGVEPKQVHA